ncbi:MAG TPA: cyclopropane-fatty-acyl-phospholipid synthase family protein [Polyangiaceae bacterium]|nr:cyclopropane-fatty-acyl-phospholipid synthase family protein [Polyangiaceae bacterium]
MNVGIELAERGLLPESLVRAGIRGLLRRRLAAEARRAAGPDGVARFRREMDTSPIALATAQANRQHYEVPAAFFERVLGPHMKYSACLFGPTVDGLGAAEAAMLELTAKRAALADGQDVLELGCGWGSLTLFIARRHRRSHVTGVSNSSSQREWILARARTEGLDNVSIVTADVNEFTSERRFDRVVSVEMFEHVRNWRRLLARVRGWLSDRGLLFLHFFAHRAYAYPFEQAADDDWMGRHFFTGGMMPSRDLLRELEVPFTLVDQWDVAGEHYAKTAEAWLENLERHAPELEAVFARATTREEAARTVRRWRLFFIACAELFGYRGGAEWFVTHALLAPRAGAAA